MSGGPPYKFRCMTTFTDTRGRTFILTSEEGEIPFVPQRRMDLDWGDFGGTIYMVEWNVPGAYFMVHTLNPWSEEAVDDPDALAEYLGQWGFRLTDIEEPKNG